MPVDTDVLLTRARRPGERAIEALLLAAAVLTIAITAGIVLALLSETVEFFRLVPLGEFLAPGTWDALFCESVDQGCSYSIWPLLAGTLWVTAIAMAVAVPTGLAAAVYLSEYAGPRVRGAVKPTLEVLAGIPTVVYGYFALTFITPNVIEPLFGQVGTFNVLAAGLVVGILVLPLVSSISQDALSSVPLALRAGGLALGARKARVTVRIVVPAALSGIIASAILAASRAIGETMAVTLAAGKTPNLSANPLEPMQTMTAYIVQVSLGETPQTDVRFNTLFAVGMTLFVITFGLNMVSAALVRRFKEDY
ncbi:MAG: phosphate ABC transporter permease subunit PstC [Actinomycetota bacterium]|nr:phosphate ABC transporter permease subunit PstC [Actinomycetota bacterium]